MVIRVITLIRVIRVIITLIKVLCCIGMVNCVGAPVLIQLLGIWVIRLLGWRTRCARLLGC